MENVITTVQLILPFIEKLDCFHNLYKIYKVTTFNISDHNSLLWLIFDEVNIMYRTECYTWTSMPQHYCRTGTDDGNSNACTIRSLCLSEKSTGCPQQYRKIFNRYLWNFYPNLTLSSRCSSVQMCRSCSIIY